VVITSVDRDDLRDGGAGHFVECIPTPARCRRRPRSKCWCRTSAAAGPALEIFADGLPDVMNHNLETVPRLYKEARPGSTTCIR
jgi:lipoic acid synthetase